MAETVGELTALASWRARGVSTANERRARRGACRLRSLSTNKSARQDLGAPRVLCGAAGGPAVSLRACGGNRAAHTRRQCAVWHCHGDAVCSTTSFFFRPTGKKTGVFCPALCLLC